MSLKQLSLASIGLKVHTGQIMSRLTVKNSELTNSSIEYKVLLPKCINSDGTINTEDLGIEILKSEPDNRRITHEGDIVIKLSAPYDAAIVPKEAEGCVVPSFCAIISGKNIDDVVINKNGKLDKYYLLAFLNSELCKRQLRAQVAGAVMTMLSVGKIESIEVPIVDEGTQRRIGTEYLDIQNKLVTIRKIAELSSKRNDIVFKELVMTNGK